MPPYLAPPYFHLSRLPTTTKLVVTGFSAATLFGLIFTGVVYFPKVLGPERIQSKEMLGEEPGMVDVTRRHFAPQEVTRRVMEQDGAPPDEVEEAARDQLAGQTRKAFDIIHPHAFLMPVLFFILCHLMEMTGGRPRFKIGLYSAAFIGMVLTIPAPLAVLHAPWMAAPCFAGFYLMLLSFSVMAVVPPFQMWFARPKG